MPLVRNTLDPVPTLREVRVRLIAPVGWFTRPDGPREVVTHWRGTVDDDGEWSVDVPANADYDIANTWYLVEEPGATHAMVVPVTAGPHELRDITITMPGGSYCGPVPTAGPTTLVQLRDVDASSAGLGQILAQTEQDPARFGFVSPSAAAGVVHTQSTPAATWTVPHGLGRYPHAMVVVEGRLVLADLDFPDLGTVVVTHAEPLAGSLHLI